MRVTVEEILEGLALIANKYIIVEGKKDKAALVALGCRKVYTLEHLAVFEVVEAIPVREVVILTDLDREGKKLDSVLKKGCDKLGIAVDDSLRLLLMKAKVSHIEGLRTFLTNANKR